MQNEKLISHDLTFLNPLLQQNGPKCHLITLSEIAECIVSPDTHQNLILDQEKNIFFNNDEEFPVSGEVPVLFPKKCHQYLKNGMLDIPLKIYEDSFTQYLLLNNIKQKSEINNLSATDIWAQRHYHRAKEFLKNMEGSVLDVGCDDINVSQQIFPKDTQYVGLDLSYRTTSPFRIIGMGEYLPFRSETFNNVTFMTSLDHIFDYHRALDEAYRVLKKNGKIFLATLIWENNADLHHDLVHFHHFREYEIMGAMRQFTIENMQYYSWKDNVHRYGLYLSARK